MKSTTPSFVLELPLNTNTVQESTILVRLDAGRQLYNACLGEALKRLDLLRQSKEFQQIRILPKGKPRAQAFNDLNKKFEFTQYSLHHYAVGIRHGWLQEHINVHIAEKIAARAFNAVQKKAFGKAKNVRFKGKNQFDTLEGQNNETGLIFENNNLKWADLEIPCIIDKENELMSYGLQHRVKYCRIVKRKVNGKNKFYVQLILEGKPYQDPEKELGKEELGMDVGPSTYAAVGETRAELKQFCEELVPKWKEKRRLQRKLDRQRRANNPEHYNENGTVKKGKKKWKQSNHYKRTKSEITELDRKTAAHRKSLHGHEQNIILTQGTVIKAERIPYKSWQKIWGKSVSIRAPSTFMSGLKRKAENAGGHFYDFPTNTTRLSQICHICGEAVKKPLSQRRHTCCGIDMQRDLYSAFLAKCIDVNTNSLDIARARMLWPGLEPVLSEAVSRAYQSANGGKIVPASFGVGNRRQSGSPVKPEETVTEAADDVVQDTFYEDESRREVT
ncbi:MAG TPA: transposase [Candidatus Methylomirabilis sp.]|nr:transposase [Candidatus Methylomirabilis sp.]